VTLAAPPPPPTVVPTTPTTPTPPGSGSTTPSGSGGSTAPTDAGGPVVLQGFYVIYVVVYQDDTASRGEADKIVARLQQAGSPAQLLPSARIPGAPPGQLWVLRDGFDTYASALAECNARRSIADSCRVVQP
jgi:hypothetical protein